MLPRWAERGKRGGTRSKPGLGAISRRLHAKEQRTERLWVPERVVAVPHQIDLVYRRVRHGRGVGQEGVTRTFNVRARTHKHTSGSTLIIIERSPSALPTERISGTSGWS